MLKYLIISAFLIATNLPANAGRGPGMGRITSVANRFQSSGQVCINNKDSMRIFMYAGPGENYQQVREIPNRQEVGLISGDYDRDGIWWWYVSYRNQRGWANGNFICK